jgi:signal transduction histidine kinase
MPSKFERNLALTFSLKLTLTISAFFLIGAVLLYIFAYILLSDAAEEMWEFVPLATARDWAAAGPLNDTEMAIQEAELQKGNTELRDELQSRFVGDILFPAATMGFFAILGGVYVSYRATNRMRRVVATVREIIRTGEISARVPTKGGEGDVTNIISLFNQMLDRGESLIRAMHESLDNVAHDLRTPMTRLRATAESALSNPEDPGRCHEAVADCMEESDRVLTMLTTLMDVAEADTGVMRLKVSEVSVRDVAADIADLYELVAEEKEVEVRVDVPDDLVVEVDPVRMRQVIANLVDNAIKYGPNGQTVRISAERQGEQAVIRVVDQGPGVAPEDRDRIWDRLYRGDHSRAQRGLGLGLSFVRSIVAAHGGEVAVSGEPGRGTTFTVKLPVKFSPPVY